MIQLEVAVINENAVMCLNRECQDRGRYDHCYIHTYLLQPCWIDFYGDLNEEQKELVLHPERFDLTG